MTDTKSQNLEIKINGLYKHFKGNLYTVLCLAKCSDDPEKIMVVYQASYGDNEIWVRPYMEFVSKVDKKKYPNSNQKYRFELVSEK